MIWVFLVLFPLLLGGPVSVRIETTSQAHCEKVRKLLQTQLEDHRSNAVITACTQTTK